jgi:hypothetical protein
MTTKMSRSDPDPAGFVPVINWPGSVIQNYRSQDPDPKEIIMDLQHWHLHTCRRTQVQYLCKKKPGWNDKYKDFTLECSTVR